MNTILAIIPAAAAASREIYFYAEQLIYKKPFKVTPQQITNYKY